MRSLWPYLYIPYRYLIFAPFAAVATLFFGTLTVVLVQFLPARTASYIGGSIWARLMSLATPMFVTVRGRENIDPRQSYVVVSNHRSQYDIFVLYGWLGVDFKWVMKKELRKVPALGVACEKLGHIYIDRSHPQAAVESIKQAGRTIVNGTSVIFFPEGTRSATGRLGPFKKGAFMMALDLNLPILPVTITGTEKILPPRSLRLLPGKAAMTIHPPIATEGFSHGNLAELMEKVREVMVKGLEEDDSI